MKTTLGAPAVAAPLLAAAALVVVLAAEWMPHAERVLTVAPPSLHARGVASEPDSVAKDTESWARTIVARPLFTVNRRPPKLAGGKNAVALTGLPRLSGIMISRAGRRAIFMPEGGKARTLAEGASVDEYTIRQIAADHVVLTGAKGEMVLRPAYDGSVGHAGGAGDGQPALPQPGFAQGAPGYQPPGFNPAFRGPGFPGMPPPQPAPANASDDDSDDAATPAPQPAAPQPFPGFRGPFVPRGRNNE
jgi:hypothetical protein